MDAERLWSWPLGPLRIFPERRALKQPRPRPRPQEGNWSNTSRKWGSRAQLTEKNVFAHFLLKLTRVHPEHLTRLAAQTLMSQGSPWTVGSTLVTALPEGHLRGPQRSKRCVYINIRMFKPPLLIHPGTNPFLTPWASHKACAEPPAHHGPHAPQLEQQAQGLW